MNIFSGIEYKVLKDINLDRKCDGIEYDSRKIKENYIDNPDKSKSDEFAYLQLDYPIEVSKRLIYSVLSEVLTID